MPVCQNCAKGSLKAATSAHGRGVASHKFSKRAQSTKRRLKPNLHKTKIIIGGISRQMLLCTKCLRKLKKQTALDA